MAKSAKFPRGSSGEAPPMLDEAQFRMTLDRPLGSLLAPSRDEAYDLVAAHDIKSLDPNKAPAYLGLHGMSQLPISDEAVSKIMGWENSPTERDYNSLPEKPGGSSGITIGFGYDIGQDSESAFRRDWAGKINQEDLDALAKTAGLKNDAAKKKLPSVSHIQIPYETALDVYMTRTIPRYLKDTYKAYPGSENLSPDSLGALLSWVFNRGPSIDSSERDAEKRMIRNAIKNGDIEDIPNLIRQSKHIWEGDPEMRGLLPRRDEEAELFQKGLDKSRNKLARHREN